MKGVGNVTLKFENGFVYTLERVRYVPMLSRNLISMGGLDDMGVEGRIENGILKVLRKYLPILKVPRGMVFMSPRLLQSYIILLEPPVLKLMEY